MKTFEEILEIMKILIYSLKALKKLLNGHKRNTEFCCLPGLACKYVAVVMICGNCEYVSTVYGRYVHGGYFFSKLQTSSGAHTLSANGTVS